MEKDLNKPDSFNIFGVGVSKLTYESFLNNIRKNISENKGLSIAYANADTLNKIYKNEHLKNVFNSFDLIHPDGIGIYLASRFLFGKDGLERRLTGSDFYELLIDESIKNNWKYFFFGHSNDILSEIKNTHPLLNISGSENGYDFESSYVVQKINEANADIVIVGLSCPIQELWIFENRDKLKFKIILTVGDGIKVFAGKKIRGPVLMRKLGLEWLVRFLIDPVSNFRKYAFGVPLFISRVIRWKLK